MPPWVSEFGRVNFLPVVERELRVAAWHSRTWWRRMLILSAAVILLLLTYWIGNWRSSAAEMGRQLFMVLSIAGLFYALFAGPLATVDCLARERREGTLGLLFLTDLRSHDVVLGKMAASSLDIVLGLLAAFPVVAIPVLLGGVGFGQLARVAGAFFNCMFLSLAIGVCASALLTSGRAALGVTVAVLVFLTIGMPWLIEGVLGIHTSTQADAYVYMCCPLYTMVISLDLAGPAARPGYWQGIVGMQLLGWTLLTLAIRHTRHSWHDTPRAKSGGAGALQRLIQGFRRRLALGRGWRSMLERNPVAWIEGRDWLQLRLLVIVFTGMTAAWVLSYGSSPAAWNDIGKLVGWPLFMHYCLCTWLAVQAPRRLADDKQSGALELLLCTPIQPKTILRGQMHILRRRFGGALAALLVLYLLLYAAYFSITAIGGGTPKLVRDQIAALEICGLVVFLIQACCVARIGLYQALVQTSSLRATFMVIWKAILLPWLLFAALMAVYVWAANRGIVRGRFNPLLFYLIWALSHLAVCGLFLAQAHYQLSCRFRALASGPAGSWWKMFGRPSI